MAGSLGGVGPGLQIYALEKVAPAFVTIGGILRRLPLLDCSLRVLFAPNHLDHSIRTVGTDVMSDNGIANVGVVACQKESSLSVSKRNCQQSEGPKKRCGTDHRTNAMLRATHTIGNQIGEVAMLKRGTLKQRILETLNLEDTPTEHLRLRD